MSILEKAGWKTEDAVWHEWMSMMPRGLNAMAESGLARGGRGGTYWGGALFVLIDPALSIMTDDVMDGRISEPAFRRAVVWFAGSRVAGAALAQLLLVPAASGVVFLARLI